MRRRAVEKMKMKIRVFSLKSRTHGFVFGALLSYMFWGSILLLRAGDVEQNPGPVDKSSKSTPAMRQSTFSSGGRLSEKGTDSGHASSSISPLQHLNLVDVMSKLDGMDVAMNGKLGPV